LRSKRGQTLTAYNVITVEREYGAGGSVIAAKLAERLGWKLYDQQLTADIARIALPAGQSILARQL
jgi:hypothetical protein